MRNAECGIGNETKEEISVHPIPYSAFPIPHSPFVCSVISLPFSHSQSQNLTTKLNALLEFRLLIFLVGILAILAFRDFEWFAWTTAFCHRGEARILVSSHVLVILPKIIF